MTLTRAPRGWHRVPATLSRVSAFAIVEMQKLRRDRTELVTRMVQPALWLLIFGTTFSKLHVINTGPVSYLAFLAPGIIAQSALFISIFYGIQIIWDRDAGILAKLLVTPAPASALISGKAFAAGVRSVAQVVGVLALAYLMGIGQAITMPLFFASNALYPVDVMPAWLHVVSTVNPLSYEVHALRALLIGTPFNPLDVMVLVVAAILGIATASTLLRRLVT
jgi:ABC-2 type transport system permease protein